ncbi:MAG: type 2 isopentenyl-diphosphate Delta-isomerase [Candidatus Marinimicrobia bacterium]|nr:type 2 isopentenyl-diphosphate Delta-isomerase [Candidatus Neomarinimicrobiota bacterium]
MAKIVFKLNGINLSEIENRKKIHLDVFRNGNPIFSKRKTGFEKYDFIPNSVNSLSLQDVKTETIFLGKKLSFPFMIGSMSGGIDESFKLNSDLSKIAEKLKIAFALGSVRPLLENRKSFDSYFIARKNAPSVPVLGNIGMGQIASGEWRSKLLEIIEDLELDALFVHFNKLQEYIQKCGDTNFINLENEIRELIYEIGIPVIAKEVGGGFSKIDIDNLINWGFKFIDVAGAGGTSWAKVENILSSEKNIVGEYLSNFGVSTSESLKYLSAHKQIYSIASGGIDNPIEIAKSLALGANITSSARIIYQTYHKNGIEELESKLENWRETLRAIMYLTGVKNIDELIGNNEILSERNG